MCRKGHGMDQGTRPGREPKRKEDRFDRTLVGAALIAFFVSVTLIFDDRFLFNVGVRKNPDAVSIGEVVRETSGVRRKFDGGLDFFSLSKSAEVFDGDTIFTGEGSSAEIKIGKNTTLSLEPGSLVVIHRERSGKPRVSVRRGSVAANLGSGQTILLDIGGKTQEISPAPLSSPATVRASVGATPELTVISGSAIARSEGEAAPLAMTPVATPAPLASTPVLTPDAVAPVGGQILTRANGTTVEPVRLVFETKREPKPEKKSPHHRVEVQVASNNTFSSIESQLVSEENARSVLFQPTRDGPFYWRARAIREDPQTVARSEWTAPAKFFVRELPLPKRKLAAQPPLSAPSLSVPRSSLSPVLEYPSRKVFLKKASDTVNFRWQTIPGASLYELTVLQRKEKGGYDVRKFKTSSTEHPVTLNQEGSLTWRVRALSDSNRTPAVQWTESEATLDVIRPLLDQKRPTYLALSSMIGAYNYTIDSSVLGATGRAASVSLTTRLVGEHWFSERFGISGFGEATTFSIASNPFTRFTFHLAAQTQFTIASDPSWQLIPAIGNEVREYFEASPSSGIEFFTYGPTVSLTLRKTFTERLRLELKTSAFLPLVPLGLSRGATLTSDSTFRNMNIGAHLMYWPQKTIGLGVGSYYDLRSISYQVPLIIGNEKITSDAAYFYVNIIYRPGR